MWKRVAVLVVVALLPVTALAHTKLFYRMSCRSDYQKIEIVETTVTAEPTDIPTVEPTEVSTVEPTVTPLVEIPLESTLTPEPNPTPTLTQVSTEVPTPIPEVSDLIATPSDITTTPQDIV